MKNKSFKVWLIDVYLSTEDEGDSAKDKFYNAIESVFNSPPSNDVEIVFDDFNVKRLVTSWSIPELFGYRLSCNKTKENTSKLIEFACSGNKVHKRT